MHLVVNPAAAGGRVGKHWPRLRERLRAAGFDVPFTMTQAPGHASELAAEAAARGVEVVVAAGGDGTICEVVQGLHDAGRGALAILPLGTGNDSARTLGVPLRLEDAASTALAGARRRFDLIGVGDRVVFNAIGVGLLGAINVNAAGIKVVRGIAAYLAAAAGSLFRYRGPHVRLESNGFDWQGRMVILAVHGGPSTGGGFRLAPSARPDDGEGDACLVEEIGLCRRLHRLGTALRGTLGEQRGSHPFRFTSLRLETAESLPAHLDGNPYHVEPPGVTFEVLPAAQEFVVPAAGGR